jgi:hypothetical protein
MPSLALSSSVDQEEVAATGLVAVRRYQINRRRAWNAQHSELPRRHDRSFLHHTPDLDRVKHSPYTLHILIGVSQYYCIYHPVRFRRRLKQTIQPGCSVPHGHGPLP